MGQRIWGNSPIALKFDKKLLVLEMKIMSPGLCESYVPGAGFSLWLFVNMKLLAFSIIGHLACSCQP